MLRNITYYRSQPRVPDRDYAELSQLTPVPSESQWRRTAADNVSDRGPPSRGPPAPADGLVLGSSALNARYMSGNQQQQQVPVRNCLTSGVDLS